MPGIASDRPTGIQINPITSIGTEVPVTPAVGDLMDAFRQGFITTEDIQRKFQQDRLANDAEKTQLQASDFQRQLAPGEFQNAQAAQGLTADQIQAAKQTLPGATSLTLGGQQAGLQAQKHDALANSDDEATRLAEQQFRETRKYELNNGHAAPKSINIPAPENAENFSTWFNREKGKDIEKVADGFEGISQDDAEKRAQKNIANFSSGFPLNSVQDNQARAAFAQQQNQQVQDLSDRRDAYVSQAWKSMVESPQIQDEYQNHLKEVTTRTVKPGDPEYLAELQKRNSLFDQNTAVTAAKVKALPEVLGKRAEYEAKAAAGDPVAKEKVASGLRDEISKDKGMTTLSEENKFAKRILDLTDPQTHPTPSNADALAALEGYIKLLDPNAVIRQGKLVVTQEMTPKLEQLGKLVSRVYSTKGGFLSPGDIAQLRDTTGTIIKASNREARQFLQVRANAATQSDIPFPQVFSAEQQDILSGKNSFAPAAGAPAAGSRTVVPTEGPFKGKTLQWVGPGATDYKVVQ